MDRIKVGEREPEPRDRGVERQVFEAGHDGQHGRESQENDAAHALSAAGRQQHRPMESRHGPAPDRGVQNLPGPHRDRSREKQP